MNDDFLIIDGVLMGYEGAGGDVVIPGDVTHIGYEAFCSCFNLRSIEIPDTVTRIGAFAFNACTSLTSVTIPSSVTSIGVRAFSSCLSLKSIKIPDSVMSIGDYAFDYCDSLTSNNPNFRFKATDAKMQCRDFQYSLGRWFELDGDVKLCHLGFHACKNPMDIFNHYSGEIGKDIRLWLVETDGETGENNEDSKVVSRRIRFVKELTISELADYTRKEKQ